MLGAVWRVARGAPGYPAALLDLAEQAPEVLYGRGDRGAVADVDPHQTVTIVGSRRATSYGLELAERIARELAAAGLVIVSGMAWGIDSAAHRGALDGGGRTIAVLGGGPDVVYPPSARRLYERIVDTGAVVSEWPPGERPAPRYFPARNRIMAALAGMIVIVEAAEPSGSLITAELGIRLGRTVAAVPGPVTSTRSEGTNRLIYDGAPMVRDAQDVLDRMLGVGARHVRGSGPPLDPDQVRQLELIEDGLATCDALAATSGCPPAEVAVSLARLELLGYVRADAAGRYVRTALAPPSSEDERGER